MTIHNNIFIYFVILYTNYLYLPHVTIFLWRFYSNFQAYSMYKHYTYVNTIKYSKWVSYVYVRNLHWIIQTGIFGKTGAVFRMPGIDMEAYCLADILSHWIIYYHYKRTFMETVYSDRTSDQTIWKRSVTTKYVHTTLMMSSD